MLLSAWGICVKRIKTLDTFDPQVKLGMTDHHGVLGCSVYPVLSLPGGFVRYGRGAGY